MRTKKHKKQIIKQAKDGIGPRIRSAIWLWARNGPGGFVFLIRAGIRLWFANRRRSLQERALGIHIPTVLAISPTMRCNYSCQGCYSRERPEDNELTTDQLNALFTEAENLGFLAVLITGGEPFMRDDLLPMIKKHQRLLFVIINNGSFITREIAQAITESGNIITLISVEGMEAETDERRGPGAHQTAVSAMRNLKKAGALFGFSVTNHALNGSQVGSDHFMDETIALGCTVGLFTEYVPCDASPHPEWLLDAEKRDAFHQRVLYLRATKKIALVQFPQDEYGPHNRCTAAGEASLHINPQGGIEPCPFVPLAVENIRDVGLTGACKSAFFRAIRAREHLLQRDRFACSLFEHLDEVESIANDLRTQSE